MEMARQELEASAVTPRWRFCHSFRLHKGTAPGKRRAPVHFKPINIAALAVLLRALGFGSKFTWHALGLGGILSPLSFPPVGNLNSTTIYACRFEFGN